MGVLQRSISSLHYADFFVEIELDDVSLDQWGPDLVFLRFSGPLYTEIRVSEEFFLMRYKKE